jgi:hypothetical protein
MIRKITVLAAVCGCALAQRPLSLGEAVDSALASHPLLAARAEQISAAVSLRD